MEGGGIEIPEGRLQLVMVGPKAVEAELAKVKAAGRAQEVVDLDLNGNQLKKLPDLSAFKGLRSLVLDNNDLSGRMKFPKLNSLDTLSLNKNKLTDVDALLKSIESFKSLRYLMMMHNPGVPDMFAAEKDLSDYAKHRLYVIFKISSLACLDYQDVTEEERAEASVRGGFAKTASPAEAEDDGGAAATVAEAVGDVADDSLGARKKDDSRAYLGYSPYKHLAHDSEGNRTIGSDDL